MEGIPAAGGVGEENHRHRLFKCGPASSIPGDTAIGSIIVQEDRRIIFGEGLDYGSFCAATPVLVMVTGFISPLASIVAPAGGSNKV